MSAYLVLIPGTTVPHSTFAENREEALKDALLFHGLNFTPPGTRVVSVHDHSTPPPPGTPV